MNTFLIIIYCIFLFALGTYFGRKSLENEFEQAQKEAYEDGYSDGYTDAHYCNWSDEDKMSVYEILEKELHSPLQPEDYDEDKPSPAEFLDAFEDFLEDVEDDTK